ncbi:fibropellin-1-like [Dendronephthya gigantea]|uniref:fibropellin-1-like n=1 Tax=Dendronephthya gigantea TaxID=151771 RepID=UPI00106C9FDF|nr:fibropellin-1-like [Dendronephthya gigantea]
MCVRDGFYVTVVGFLILTCVESLTSTDQKTVHEHGSLKINDDRVKNEWKLSSDLDKTFNTFKRKDNIGKTQKKTSKTEEKLHKDERGHIIGPSKGDMQQKISGTQDSTPENTKRQYIFGAPSLISAGAIPRRFVAFPNPGLHTGACSHHVCYHGGVCVRTSHGFYCDCPEQYLGQHCEFKRACLNNPCKNAGTCTELGQGDFTCTCAVGSKGKACELKDSCVPNPCNNEAACTEMDDGYHCTCKLGYKGDRCQNKAFCFPNPCKNGATCIDRNDRQFECSCALGFKGELCEVSSECKNDPCVNGGTCIEKAVGYRCACLKGFVGKNCEVTLCNPNPCANNGKCSVAGNRYNCACTGQYTGDHCEVLNPCRANPCLNGGQCVVSELTSGYTNDGFSCKCPKGYYGNMCQMKYIQQRDKVESLPKYFKLSFQYWSLSGLSMAKTNVIILAIVSWFLLSGVQGKLAKTNGKSTNEHKTKIELHNGRLKGQKSLKSTSKIPVQDGDSFVRQVSSEKIKNATNDVLKRTMAEQTSLALNNMASGVSLRRPLKVLQLKTASPSVRSRLTSLRSTTFKPIHIYGSVPFKTFLSALSKTNGQENTAPTPALQSEVPQVAGQSSPHLPLGSPLSQEKALQNRQFLSPGAMPVPIGPQGGAPMLLQAPLGGFQGMPLEGGLPVVPQANLAGYFGYPVGYHEHQTTHHHLHRKVFSRAKCFPNPCQNGGSCTAFSSSYECSCPAGFKGHSCEERNQCVPNPCKNGGNCYDDGDNYKCTCIRGYTGYNCGELSKCLPNPCKNGATCLETGESYHCECPENFNGVHCEVHDYCGQDNPCLNGGHCNNKESGYECNCKHGYMGHDCAEFDVCNENPCDNGGICKNIEGGQFLCKCGHGYRGMTCEEKIPPCDLDPCRNGGTCREMGEKYLCHCPDNWKGRTCEAITRA